MTSQIVTALRRSVRSGASWLCIASAMAAAPAYAQAPADDQLSAAESADAPQEDAEQSAIVVTGTRLVGFSAPTPVTSITAQDLEAKAIRSVTDLMQDIPALRFNQNNSQASAPIGASNLDLRGLGASRTLLLVDGRRFAATDPSGGVDISVIPAVLISKIEIVTGGASAAYGSDAVSGVVNMTLDSRMEGIKGSVQYGQTTHNDHYQPSATLAVGKSLADGRLHLVAAGDFYRNTGQLDQSTRDWGRQNYALLTNPAYTATNGQPQRLILPNSTTPQLAYGGVTAINSIPALRGLAFGPNGTVIPYNYGTNVGSSFATGGDGATPMAVANITPRYTRYSAFGKATFDINDNISIYADVLWARSEAYADQLSNPNPGDLVIRRDNAFLPTAVRNLIPVGSTLTIGRLNGEDGVFNTTTKTTVQRYGFGAEGKFGDGWRWNVYAQLSRNRYERLDAANRINANWLKAVDAIISPTTGQPVCRVNADAVTTNDDPACVPANVFGAGSISAASVAYYTGTSIQLGRQKQDVFAASLNGSPFTLPAGDVRVAVGAEYRTDSVSQTSDPISQAGGWRQINAQVLNGRVKVKEAFVELGVPLLRDAPLAANLDLNGAARVTDYSTSGTVVTWKVGANYTPVTGLRFRGTISRDIRAPNVNELFSGQALGIPIIIDPFFTPTRSGAPNVLTGGNPNLQPEKAKTYTVGVVVEPTALRGFHLAVDYYSISIDGAILALTGQQVVDGCFQGQTALCGAVTRDPTTNFITQVQATLLNAAKFETKGIDFELAYTMPVGDGTLTARALANYVSKLYNSNLGAFPELSGTAGQSNGIPHWRGNIGLNYRTDRFNVGWLVRYVGGGLYNNQYVEGGGVNSINTNRVGSRTYVDLNAGFKIMDQIELFAKINNLLDRDPPITPQVVTAASAAGSPFYDRVGRLITGGVRFKF